MMEIGKLDWSDRILALCGIDRDRVPPVGIPSGQAGTLSAKAAAQTGLPAGIPICRGAGDQQCAAIGAGVVAQGAAEFTVGTAGVMVAQGLRARDAELVRGDGASLKWWRDNLEQQPLRPDRRGERLVDHHGGGLYESIAQGGQYAKLNEFSTRYF